MKNIILKNTWWVVIFLSLILLVFHSLSIGEIKVDNISIVLILIIILSPFITTIKKIKYGDFEAEIDSKEIQKLKENVERSITKEEQGEEELPEIYNITDNIKQLVLSDPVIALAKLRIEIEKVLTKLYKMTHKELDPQKPLPLSKMLYELFNKEIISNDSYSPIREVISICNRAIHGEEIKQKDAELIIETGISLLENLYWESKDYVLKPNETTVITNQVLEEYSNAKYKLVTIIPYVKKPSRNIRILDQAGLDEFLEDYNEYAEFIVELTKIE